MLRLSFEIILPSQRKVSEANCNTIMRKCHVNAMLLIVSQKL